MRGWWSGQVGRVWRWCRGCSLRLRCAVGMSAVLGFCGRGRRRYRRRRRLSRVRTSHDENRTGSSRASRQRFWVIGCCYIRGSDVRTIGDRARCRWWERRVERALVLVLSTRKKGQKSKDGWPAAGSIVTADGKRRKIPLRKWQLVGRSHDLNCNDEKGSKCVEQQRAAVGSECERVRDEAERKREQEGRRDED